MMKGLLVMEEKDQTKKAIKVIESWIIRLAPFGMAPGTVHDLLTALKEIRAYVVALDEGRNQQTGIMAEKEAEIKRLTEKLTQMEVAMQKAVEDAEKKKKGKEE